MKEVLDVLSEKMKTIVLRYPLDRLEEIRIRTARPLELYFDGKPVFPLENEHYYIVEREETNRLFNQISQYSVYALEEELKRGYITIPGGHRIGLGGKVSVTNGQVKALSAISSLNIRISRQVIGVSLPLIPFLYDNRWFNTLIIGPPQTGKTTILRDLARIVSSGCKKPLIPSEKVAIVDERSEIAACIQGVPTFDLGFRTDVLDGCPKAEGMMMMIRSMSPNVLIVDEIGRNEDVEAIMEAMHAGVKVFATLHGNGLEHALLRPSLKPLFEKQVFERCLTLHPKRRGSVTIFNEKGQKLH